MKLVSSVYTMLIFTCVALSDAHWWSVADNPMIKKLEQDIISICDHIEGLTRNQIALCRRYHDHMSYVSEGAKNGISECQNQFKGHRWNCSTVDNDITVFGKVSKIGSKEMAFTYAIASAGVVHSIAKACKKNTFESCGCSKKPRPTGLHQDWRWGGCGDETNYAYGFAREFVDARERDDMSKGRKAKGKREMNMHNNEAGRMTVVRGERPNCRCHGVSGSCSIKTCWFQVPDFQAIGHKLRLEHINAIEMRMNKKGQLRTRKSGRDKPTITELVYIESSPDYCQRNSRTGVLGTKGRECNLNSSGDDGCGLLCCGRGYKRERVEIVEKCNCKFQWCCTVKCQVCRKKVTKYICN